MSDLFDAAGFVTCPCCGGSGRVAPDALRDLDDPLGGKARNSDPSTSHEAARMPDDPLRRSQRHDVMQVYIQYAGVDGLTADEADARYLGWGVNTTSTRVSDLRRWGLLESTGLRRRTRKGSTAEAQRVTLLGFSVWDAWVHSRGNGGSA